MNERLEDMLSEMYESGVAHDSKVKTHTEQMLNITPDTGLFLSIFVQSVKAKRILEIGTSNGYSTLWLADAAQCTGGLVTTVEVSQKKVALAKNNMERSELSKYIDVRLADIRTFLQSQANDSFDLIFLDAERPQYTSYWNEIDRVLRIGGVLVVDNALSPKPEELLGFFSLVRDSARYLTQTLRIGNGEFLALKQK